MKTTLPLLIAVAAIALFYGPKSYAAAVQFSPTSNPNGSWYFGYQASALGSNFTLFDTSAPIIASTIDSWQSSTYGSLPHVAHNGTGSAYEWTAQSIVWLMNEISLHPGSSGQFAVVRFVVPANDFYDVAATFFGIDGQGGTTDVHVLVNNVSVFDGAVSGYRVPTTFTSRLNLAQNDTVDFAVGYGANLDFRHDSTGLSAEVSVVPEPASQMLTAIGIVALVSRRRKPLKPGRPSKMRPDRARSAHGRQQ